MVRFPSRWIFTRIDLDFASLKQFVLLHFIFLVQDFLELYYIHREQIIAKIIYWVMYGRSTDSLYFYPFHFVNWSSWTTCFFFSYIKWVFFQISDNQTGIITVYLGASVLPILWFTFYPELCIHCMKILCLFKVPIGLLLDPFHFLMDQCLNRAFLLKW